MGFHVSLATFLSRVGMTLDILLPGYGVVAV